MPKTAKILLTGADGFLGSYVSEAFRFAGIAHTPSTIKDFDILNKKDVLSKTRGFSEVIHLAGNVRTSATDTADNHFRINSIGTQNVLEACRTNKIRRIVLASTVEVYGETHKPVALSETAITNPVDFYGQSKLLAEHFCAEYHRKFGINFTALRFSYIYGNGMHPSRIVSKIVDSAVRGKKLNLSIDGDSFTDFIYVRDASRAVLLALSKKRPLNRAINISSGRKANVMDFIKAAKYFFPDLEVSVSRKKENKNHHIYLNSLAKSILNFKPEYDIKSGLEDYISCLKK